jgi:Raf kinase inhibitor-like YbhB/YbcL family protein
MAKMGRYILFLVLILFHFSPARGDEVMKITSPDFRDNSAIPQRFTCQGEEALPRFELFNVPEKARSMVFIVDDPDAPVGVWDHWIVFNIDPHLRTISDQDIGTKGMNSAGRLDWHGPCPPSGTHRYFFKVYALDDLLDLKEGADKADIEKAMQGHILAMAHMTGLYKKK